MKNFKLLSKGIAGYAHKKSPSTDFVHSKLI